MCASENACDRMESDLKTLLEARKLGDTVPVLEAYGVQGLETLELLEDTDIDAMAMIEKHRLAPMTGRLLKKELPMLVPALAQKRKEQEEQRKRKEEEEEQKRKEEVRAKIELEQDILKMLPSDASDECRQAITDLAQMRDHLYETREQLKKLCAKTEAWEAEKRSTRGIMEFVFKQVCGVRNPHSHNHVAINLQQYKISDSIVEVLATWLKTELRVSGLNLEHNEISDNGVLALVELLKSNEQIASLNLGRNKISDTGAEVLFQWLLEIRAPPNRRQKVSVNLSGNNISDAFKGKILLHHSGLGLVLQ